MNKPEVFVNNCASKFDEQSGALKDEATRKIVAQQLEAFVKFIERQVGKA